MRFGIALNTQDPPSGENIPRIYQEAFREAELAEELGFELAVVGEHHYAPDGYMTSPLAFCAALAARTSRMVIASDITELLLWHPLHVAETGSVVDNISGGRFALGVGLGPLGPRGRAYRAPFGIPPNDVIARYEESIEIIRRGWRDETFSFSGKHFDLKEVRISPRPVQEGGPPIWIGAISKVAAMRAGRIGDGWPTDNLQTNETMREWIGEYRACAAEHGSKSEALISRSAWVSENPSEIEKLWWPHVKGMFEPYAPIGLFKDPVGLRPPSEWTLEGLGRNRLITGNPKDVIAQIEACRDATGCETMIMLFRHPSGPDHEEVVKCMKLFGREVIPHFK